MKEIDGLKVGDNFDVDGKKYCVRSLAKGEDCGDLCVAMTLDNCNNLPDNCFDEAIYYTLADEEVPK